MQFIILLVGMLVLTCAAPCDSLAIEPQDRPALPNFNLMFNSDGDLSATGETPVESVRNLQQMIDRLAGSSVRTVMYSVAADRVLNYHLMHPGGDSVPGDPNPAYCLDGVYHLHYYYWPSLEGKDILQLYPRYQP